MQHGDSIARGLPELRLLYGPDGRRNHDRSQVEIQRNSWVAGVAAKRSPRKARYVRALFQGRMSGYNQQPTERVNDHSSAGFCISYATVFRRSHRTATLSAQHQRRHGSGGNRSNRHV